MSNAMGMNLRMVSWEIQCGRANKLFIQLLSIQRTEQNS